jgi:hypothetical protein
LMFSRVAHDIAASLALTGALRESRASSGLGRFAGVRIGEGTRRRAR